jgi:SPP1 family phage portal protein
MQYINPNEIITSTKLKKIIENDASNNARLTNLYNYYIGTQSIASKTVSDTSKPNNKITENYCSYIADFYTGYFLGNGISYSSKDENLFEAIKPIFEYNDEQEENISLALDTSIYGIACELSYIDNDKNIRFKRLNPVGIIPLYSNDISSDLLYVIRYYSSSDVETQDITYYAEVYSSTDISYYQGESPVLMRQETHTFNMVPISIYYNNQDAIGDFSPIISMQDAINKLDSFSVDSEESFADCYMVLKGLDGTDADDIATMKQNKVLLLPLDAEASYLTKQVNDASLENLKKRLVDTIHKISKCPDLTDQSFGTQSGIAMQYKLIGFEANTSRKERYFKKGIQKRIELIMSYMSMLGSNYNYRDIDITFSRSLPTSDTEAVDSVVALQGIVSKETLLGQLSFVEDPSEEIARLEKETNIIDNKAIDNTTL